MTQAVTEDVYLGTVITLAGEHLRVYLSADGDVLMLGTVTVVRLGPGGASVLREFLDRAAMPGQAPACRCAIDGPGEVIPAACPVHGIPCEGCGGVEECKPGCPGEPVDGEGSEVD